MQMQAQQSIDPAQLATMQTKMTLNSRLRSGIGWFYWIAALSIINSLAYQFGATFTFIFGLGITQVVDGIVTGISEQLGQDFGWVRVVGIIVNIGLAALFALIGYVGQKRVRWPVIIGMVLYVLDGLLVLVFQDYLGAAFHLWALFGIWTGLKAMQQLTALERPAGVPVTPVIGSL
jgi:hypothetical protein